MNNGSTVGLVASFGAFTGLFWTIDRCLMTYRLSIWACASLGLLGL